MTERREQGIILLAVSAVLILPWAMLPHDVFFTGDSAVKLLQVENLLANRYSSVVLQYNGSDIDPNSVISPFLLGPSVYIKDGKNYSVFPVLFAFLTSLFYVVFGYAGLYVLPLVGAVLCMPLAYAIARRFVPHRTALLAAAAAVLATPLFFYSQTFWEHVPCVALFLASVWFLMRCGDSAAQAAISGLLLGISVWLRTEMLALAVSLLLFGHLFLQRRRIFRTAMAAMAVPLAGLLLFNKVVYGEWLGHVIRNLVPLPGRNDSDLLSIVKMRVGWLWTSLLGLNSPQVLSAEEVGWDQSIHVIRSNTVLELLALVAVGGIGLCSVIAIVHGRSAERKDLGGRASAVSLARNMQLGLLALLAVAVGWYVTTFPRDRSPLITVLKSGGMFTFSPFLAAVLIAPALRIGTRPWGREFNWLLCTCLVYAAVMPVLAPNDGGIRYGARYLLPVIALLAILAVATFHVLWSGRLRRTVMIILAVLLALSLVIEARGWQLLRYKKIFARDFTAALLVNPADRIAMTYWWIPFEAPQVLRKQKVHNVRLTERAVNYLLSCARQAGDESVDVVVVGRMEAFPFMTGIDVVDRTEVVHDFDTHFNVTIFRLAVR